MKYRALPLLILTLLSSPLLADRWDIAQGNHVLASSPLIFPVERMFGVDGDGAGELTSCIFSDADPPDLIDFAEWRTDEELPLTGYTIVTGADTGVAVI